MFYGNLPPTFKSVTQITQSTIKLGFQFPIKINVQQNTAISAHMIFGSNSLVIVSCTIYGKVPSVC